MGGGWSAFLVIHTLPGALQAAGRGAVLLPESVAPQLAPSLPLSVSLSLCLPLSVSLSLSLSLSVSLSPSLLSPLSSLLSPLSSLSTKVGLPMKGNEEINLELKDP